MCITKRINYAFYYYINASDKKTKTIWDNGFCPGTIGTKIRDNAGTKRKKVKVEPCFTGWFAVTARGDETTPEDFSACLRIITKPR